METIQAEIDPDKKGLSGCGNNAFGANNETVSCKSPALPVVRAAINFVSGRRKQLAPAACKIERGKPRRNGRNDRRFGPTGGALAKEIDKTIRARAGNERAAAER